MTGAKYCNTDMVTIHSFLALSIHSLSSDVKWSVKEKEEGEEILELIY
jgi:hypothetical protein